MRIPLAIIAMMCLSTAACAGGHDGRLIVTWAARGTGYLGAWPLSD